MAEQADAPRHAWATTRVQVHEGSVVLASLPIGRLRESASLLAAATGPFAALVVEPVEVSLTLAVDDWAGRASAFPDARVAGPYRVITLDAELALDLVGYLAPAAARLAEAGVGIVPQCGYRTDHLLVRAEDCDRAVEVLESFIGLCRSG